MCLLSDDGICTFQAKPLPDANVSPYPMLKGLRSSHMPALVQYAEAEAVLKRVDASSAFLEANLEAIMNAQNEVDIGFLLSGSNPDRSADSRGNCIIEMKDVANPVQCLC